MHLPTPREAAQLLLRIIESKAQDLGKPVSRFRISEASLLRTFGRQRLDPVFVAEVQEWLLIADWTLFFAGDTYAIIRTKSVEGWTRLASKWIAGEIEQVRRGTFEFSKLDYLFEAGRSGGDDGEIDTGLSSNE